MTDTLRLATRGSELALRQAQRVANALGNRRRETELVEVETTGDSVRDELIHRLGKTGAFDLAVDDLLVEAADERAGLAEPMNQFVPDAVAGRLHLHEFDLAPAAREGVGNPLGLSERELGAPRRQANRLCHARRWVAPVETPFVSRGSADSI